LMIGVVISYVLLFVVVLLAAAFTIDDGLLALTLQHPVAVWDFVEVAWMTTSAALIGGALGGLGGTLTGNALQSQDETTLAQQ